MYSIDMIGDEEKSKVIDKIPCRNCERVYIEHIGEMGRPLGTRVKEHHKEVDSITGAFTGAERRRPASICNKSAIMDHICNDNLM